MHLLGFLLGILGNVTAMLVQLSPLPTFWQIAKAKSTGSFSAQPYVWGLMAALLWSLYGVLRDQVPVITINAACVAFQLAYLSLYLCYATTPQRIRTCCILLLAVALVGSVVVVVVRFEHSQGTKSHHDRTSTSSPVVQIVGIVCTISGVLSCAAPLIIMHKVIRTSSVEYMPFALSLCLFLNGATWLAYALSIKDLFQLIPNAIGTSLSASQLALYTFYKIYGVNAPKVVDQDTATWNQKCDATTPSSTLPDFTNQNVDSNAISKSDHV